MPDQGELDHLKQELSRLGGGIEDKYRSRTLHLEKLGLWLAIAAALGALIAGISRIIPDESFRDFPTLFGIILSFVCTASLAWFSYKKLELGSELTKTLQISRNLLETHYKKDLDIITISNKIEAANEVREKFRHLLLALDRMNEVAERIPLGADIHEVIETMMDAGLSALLDAFGFEKREYWAISIFSEEDIDHTTVMRRRIARWFDRSAEIRVPRDWEKGEGFTGAAWGSNSERIEEDATNPEIERFYPVPPGKYDENDKKYYVSFAAIPIRVGSEDKIWGIITVTSSAAGRFTRDVTDDRSFNTDVVRQVEKLIAVQVALRTP